MTQRRAQYLSIFSAIVVGILLLTFFAPFGEYSNGGDVSGLSDGTPRQPVLSEATTATRNNVPGRNSELSGEPERSVGDDIAGVSSGRSAADPTPGPGNLQDRPASDSLRDDAESKVEDRETTPELEVEPGSELPCWRLTSNLPENYYTVSQDREEAFSGESSARIDSVSSNAQFGTLSQTINAAAFAGKRVEFSAFLKFEDVSRGVSLWVIATDAAGNITVSQRLNWVPGTFDWHSRNIIVDVPIESVALSLAVNILGEGTLWVDDARIVDVGPSADLTFPERSSGNGWKGKSAPPDAGSLPDSTWNMDFETWDADNAVQRPCLAEAR